jgi:hypothetical protein
MGAKIVIESIITRKLNGGIQLLSAWSNTDFTPRRYPGKQHANDKDVVGWYALKAATTGHEMVDPFSGD